MRLESAFARMRELRVHRAVLWALVVGGSALRVREAFAHNPMDELFSDPLRHWTFAKETLSTQPWTFIDPPLFQIWLSVIQKWSMGAPDLVAVYVASLSILTPWLWYRFLREALTSRSLALLGWAAIAWLPSWITIYRYFMTETLLLPLLGASLWLTWRADRKRTLGSLCALVVVWTLTSLTRGIAVPLAGVSGLWVWFRHPQKLRAAGASALLVAVLIGPFAVRNHHLLGLWSPFGTGWPNQIYAASGAHDIHLHLTYQGGSYWYEFGSPSVYGSQLAPLSNWTPKRAGVVTVTADFARGPLDWTAAYEQNAAHGMNLLRLRWENVILVMLGQSWPDSNTDSPVARAAIALRWIWAPLLVLTAVAVAVVRPVRPLLPILIATWFFFQAGSLLAINEGRYRKPLEGLLVAEVVVLVDAARGHARRARAASRA